MMIWRETFVVASRGANEVEDMLMIMLRVILVKQGHKNKPSAWKKNPIFLLLFNSLNFGARVTCLQVNELKVSEFDSCKFYKSTTRIKDPIVSVAIKFPCMSRIIWVGWGCGGIPKEPTYWPKK